MIPPDWTQHIILLRLKSSAAEPLTPLAGEPFKAVELPPCSCPINSRPVSKTNGGFRKFILMKEKRSQGARGTCEKERATAGSYEDRVKEDVDKNVCVCV